ncbi:ABC transporter permease [Microtetraspora sp. NBRC 16547]|nr:ABC transporter permease [Microtetraspora sp. NBRC 16547]
MTTPVQTQTSPPTATSTSAEAMERVIFAERRAARRKETILTWAIRIGVAAIFVSVWYVASSRKFIDPLLVSSPDEVISAFVTQLTEPRFWTDVASTFGGAMAGLVSGAALGILSGVALARWPVLDRAAGPFLTLANSLPRPALAPIFILWFGLGVAPKALVAASVVYFVLLTNTASALRGIDHDIDTLAKSLSMSPVQRFVKVEFPSALPTITGGLRLGAVYSVLGAVVSEMVGAYTGLGQRLVVMTNNFQVAESFAVLLAMGLMSTALDYTISALERLVRKRAR